MWAAPGSPSARTSAALASFGIPSFTCTPDHFPDRMATALSRQHLPQWAAAHDIVTRGRLATA